MFSLTTERLLLRPLSHLDFDFMAAMLGDPMVMRFYPQPLSRRETRAWIDRQLERYRSGLGPLLAVRRADYAPVGQVGMAWQRVQGTRRPELGWILHRFAWGRGYAREAAAAWRNHAFGTLGLDSFISLIRPTNVPSIRVAERIGARPGPTVSFHGFPHVVYECRSVVAD